MVQNTEYVKNLFDEIRKMPIETECVEFKEAKNNFDFDELGRYFSALSNEANLRGRTCAYLVFGLSDSKHIVGTTYKNSQQSLDQIKRDMMNHTNDKMTFNDIYELKTEEGRIIIFEIPSAPFGIPTYWKGYYYARAGQHLGALNISKIDRIRNQVNNYDWSAQIIDEATVDDLDEEAIIKAKNEYIKKHPHLGKEVNSWNTITFLNKTGLCLNGKITNTAIILLGKSEKGYYLGSFEPQITWVLHYKNKITPEDYEHFKIPMIISIDKALAKIRNLKYRYMAKEQTWFPNEIPKYNEWVLRESLNNSVAHQLYSKQGRVTITESEDEVVFSNFGEFFPETIENAINSNAGTKDYQNKFLAKAMVELNMIDTIGSGIKRMFEYQMERYFPLPTYDLSKPDMVNVTIIGKVINDTYTKLLANRNIDLHTTIVLDKIQKNIEITKEEYETVKKQKLVEGRFPKIYISSGVAEVLDLRDSYIKNKGFDDEYYKELIIKFIKQYGEVKRTEIDKLLISKLPEILNEEQKKSKIKYLLRKLSMVDNKIENVRNGNNSYWKLK